MLWKNIKKKTKNEKVVFKISKYKRIMYTVNKIKVSQKQNLLAFQKFFALKSNVNPKKFNFEGLPILYSDPIPLNRSMKICPPP